MKYAFLIPFLVAGAAHAYTGNDLLKELEGTDSQQLGAVNYIRGVLAGIETMEAVTERRRICVPNGVTLGQINDLVLADLRKNPSGRHEEASDIAFLALLKTWPCKKAK
ncbi:Rap1a/Tai family immunity protein [Variovorax sp. EL159]|uniref:Rap1a/Tai family immunity protein n=1 Tax=Variovorax sp. EL159 TaxID=1566270 RepID=UPI000887D02F|nr:Rap1a/Tai family immunity protein [Variovorax sp. EL159]SCX65487.1 hypothetical protein SAMN03159363_2605 [Variovorax sp. EL159]